MKNIKLIVATLALIFATTFAAQAQVDSLRNDGANYVVCLGHLGDADESIGNRSTDLIEQVEGIDLFVDGHSHTVIDGGEMDGDTLRVSTGCYSEYLGYVVLASPAHLHSCVMVLPLYIEVIFP